MNIGRRIRNLRLKKGLTQEELGERTDLTKGYISQIERDLSSPSIETFFNILEVLGCPPREFFDEGKREQKVVYTDEDLTEFADEERGYTVQWLVPESNENEMEPILLTIAPGGKFKEFEPSSSDTFAYVLSGSVKVRLGNVALREVRAFAQLFLGKPLLQPKVSDSSADVHPVHPLPPGFLPWRVDARVSKGPSFVTGV